MAQITRDTIDKIYGSINIVDVVGDYVNLKRRGANHVGLSPFVNEKSPSFYVNPAKNIFKDFSSGVGGDAIGFVMEMEKCNYPEALRILARKYNIEIKEENVSNEEAIKQKQENDTKETLYTANEFAKNYFKTSLHDNAEGQALGLSYFEERKISIDTVRKFELGYNVDAKTDFTDFAMNNGYTLDVLVKAGLTKTNEAKNWKVDAFNGRVIFPVHNLTGRVVGFGARILGNNKDVAKYINTSESEVYIKSKILYGLHVAKKEISKTGNVFLTEGYMDVISMVEAGFDNTVASSGTSLTEEQIRQLKKFATTITILYDGDKAGVKAAIRGINMILAEGLNVKLVLFPDNDDPDSYSKKVGREAFHTYLENNTLNFVQYHKKINGDVLKNDPLKKTEIIHTLVETLAYVSDQIARSVYIKLIAQEFDIDETVLVAELNKLLRKKINAGHSPSIPITEGGAEQMPLTPEDLINEMEAPATAASEQQEYDLTRLIVEHGTQLLFFDVTAEDGTLQKLEISVCELIMQLLSMEQVVFKNKLYATVIKEVEHYFETGFVPNEHFFIHHSNNDIKQFAITATTSQYEHSPQWLSKFNIIVLKEESHLRTSLEKTIKLYKYNMLVEIGKQNIESLGNSTSPDEQTDLLLLQKQLDTIRISFSEYLKPVV
jgi:DNA primase